MIGQWIGVKLSPNLHPTVYNAILPLLAPEEDLVVRITAAQTLKIDILLIYNTVLTGNTPNVFKRAKLFINIFQGIISESLIL